MSTSHLDVSYGPIVRVVDAGEQECLIREGHDVLLNDDKSEFERFEYQWKVICWYL